MSFEEEEEDEDENSSSSSQLNSNTRPSSATSRKSARVSEQLPRPAETWTAVFRGLLTQDGGRIGCEEMTESWLSWG